MNIFVIKYGIRYPILKQSLTHLVIIFDAVIDKLSRFIRLRIMRILTLQYFIQLSDLFTVYILT